MNAQVPDAAAATERVSEYRWTVSPMELDATREKFAKINARAVKRGFTGRLSLQVQGPRTISQTAESGLPVEIVVYDVEVTGDAPRYAGWRLLAALDFDPHAGLITRCAPGVDTIDRSKLREGWCEHCGTSRPRRKMYVVGDDTGRQIQVGSSCLKDFLGHNASVVFVSESEVSDALFGNLQGSRRDVAYSTDTVIAVAWACIKTFGWEPSAGYGISTRDRVLAALRPSTKADRELAAEILPLVPEMADKAAQVRAFITSEDFAGPGEYVTNLKAIIAAEHVTTRNFGMLVSAPQTWARHHERTLLRVAHNESTRNSVHVGEVGDRIERDLTLTSIRYIPGNYGTTSLYTFSDRDGNIFKWFSSTDILEDREGDTLPIKGTIKDHDEFGGAKQTVLTRCKIITVVDRLGKKLAIAQTDVDGVDAASVLRRDPQSWTTEQGTDNFVRVIEWLDDYLSTDGELHTTQRVWNVYGQTFGLDVTRDSRGKVRVELRSIS